MQVKQIVNAVPVHTGKTSPKKIAFGGNAGGLEPLQLADLKKEIGKTDASSGELPIYASDINTKSKMTPEQKLGLIKNILNI